VIFVKHVRNKVKSKYKKDDSCYICGSADSLEFHHLLCLSVEVKKLLLKFGYRKYPEESDPKFTDLAWAVAESPDLKNPEHYYTLCKKCHKQLHKIYGQNYIAWKAVKKYIEKQREKLRNA